MAAQAANTAPAGARQDERDPWLRTFFLNRLRWLDTERLPYWDTWRDLAKNFAPRRGKFLVTANDPARGKRKDQRIIDNTPLIVARVMASGMMAGISSPARPWFRLRLASDQANKSDGARAWLDEVQRRMLQVFAQSNLYNCLHTLYGEIGVFGTAALWIDEDEEDVVRGYTLTVGEYWLASSKRLAVDTLYRSLWWTVRQIVDTFGRDVVSDAIRSLYDSGQLDREFEIVHAVEPNPNAAPSNARIPKGSAFPWDGRLASRLPWRSVWFERATQGEQTLLRVSGYTEFPAMCPRWEVAGSETYGSGSTPGWVGLGDAQSLQVLQRRGHELVDKAGKPPMVGPPELNNKPASLLAGGLTITASSERKTFYPAIEIKPEAITANENKITQTQQRVQEAFYANLWLMMTESDRREITAREIDERREEKMLMLGPVLERLHDELLDPLVKRVFNIMARHGLIPPPPQGLNVATMQIEFISILAQAQKAVGTSAIERMWQFGLEIAKGGKPEALDRLDVDGTMDAYADMTGVPAGTLVDVDKAQQARQARANAQQQQHQAELLQQLSQAGKNVSQIDVGGGQNAVAAMLGRT